METWYIATGGGWPSQKIKEVDVERSTKSCIFVAGGERRLKLSSWDNFFPTWQEAHDFLRVEAEKKLKSVKEQLGFAEEELRHILALKNPADKE
jgi:hypothetical protein